MPNHESLIVTITLLILAGVVLWAFFDAWWPAVRGML